MCSFASRSLVVYHLALTHCNVSRNAVLAFKLCHVLYVVCLTFVPPSNVEIKLLPVLIFTCLVLFTHLSNLLSEKL